MAEQVGRAALPPGSTIGILGGGQLGRMLALAAARLGFRCHVFCPDPRSPAFDVSAAHTIAAYDEFEALDCFAAAVDVATWEFENVDLAAVERLATTIPVRPGGAGLATAQDRLAEKRFLTGAGIAVAPFASVGSEADFATAGAVTGFPAILKARRFGYDGKGQRRVGTSADLQVAFIELGRAPAILERVVAFEREISVVAVRGLAGEVAAYDAAENVHEDHILRTSTVPAAVAQQTAAAAALVSSRIAAALGHVGVLAVEFFVVPGSGAEALLVNEIAPRVHNSGHWTEDACAVSQFENHVRAVAGWPLGPTGRHHDAEMTNMIGEDVARWASLAADPGARLHLYGKASVRPGRKMGHVNRLFARHDRGH